MSALELIIFVISMLNLVMYVVLVIDVEMADNSQNKGSLKPTGGVGKMSKRQFKVGKRRRHGKGKGKGKVKRRHI